MSIHPSVIDKLDPQYVAFHNAYIKDHVVPAETLPWDPKIREGPTVPGSSEPLEVSSTKDYNISKARLRVFTPKGERPVGGWPVFIWFHGGQSAPVISCAFLTFV
jgi:acetyl esterase/lipase